MGTQNERFANSVSAQPRNRRAVLPVPKTMASSTSKQNHNSAEAALARSNEMLRISQMAGGTGSFEWDIPTNTLVWSENHARMFGL